MQAFVSQTEGLFPTSICQKPVDTTLVQDGPIRAILLSTRMRVKSPAISLLHRKGAHIISQPVGCWTAGLQTF